MNVKWWFNIADSTVYSTLKTLEKKGYILGAAEKVGNMPDRTVYSLSDMENDKFIDALKASILQFNYDTNIFSLDTGMLVKALIRIVNHYRYYFFVTCGTV